MTTKAAQSRITSKAHFDTFGSREAPLEHFREKTWITPADLDALGRLWDEFAGK
jgi:hypothetical protein